MLPVRWLLAKDCRTKYVVGGCQMLYLLREASSSLESTGGWDKTIFLFRHGISRRNHLLFYFGNPYVEFFADTSTLRRPGRLRRQHHAWRQEKYEHHCRDQHVAVHVSVSSSFVIILRSTTLRVLGTRLELQV